MGDIDVLQLKLIVQGLSATDVWVPDNQRIAL
jgi:hypothetical protein